MLRGSAEDISYALLLLVSVFFLVVKLRVRDVKFKTSLAFLIMFMLAITPLIMMYVCPLVILQKAYTLRTVDERAEFIASYIRNTTVNIWFFNYDPILFCCVTLHRARGDFNKFVLFGVGGCGEIALAETVFLRRLGVEAREVHLHGEEHAFVEVRINDTWFVSDVYRPGLMMREEYAKDRIKQIGGLSHVVAYTEHGMVDLTKAYVPSADEVIIKVIYHGEPVMNARVKLIHKFRGNDLALPELHTDAHGIAIIYLGPMSYNNTQIEPAERFYWIYINDENTGFKVSGEGKNKVQYITIDLALLET